MRSLGKIKLKGLGVSSGVAIGHVRLFQVSTLDVGDSVVLIQAVDQEIGRLEEAIAQTRSQIEDLGKRVSERGDHKALGDVLTMHLLLLEDKMIVGRAAELIRAEKYGAEYALSCVLREAEARYADLPDLFRERFKDIEDICRRIMDNLRGVRTQSLENLDEECVVVSSDLSPSDTASMHQDKVMGFATDAGGKTSHTAILARALEIPAVVGTVNISHFAKDNDLIIIDGDSGLVILNPDEADIREYRDKQDQYRIRQSRLFEMSELPPVTLDGHYIDLAANIEFASEVETIKKYAADGVGLYRTEYLFLNRVTIPSEEEQFQHYNEVASKLAPRPVIVRTLDIGGDKFAHSLEAPHELNPFLGCRAIRFSLANRELFRTQLRAILRASIHGNLRIMYPLISGCGELLQARDILEAIKEELRCEGQAFDENIQVGAMIEVPSAVMVARDLAKYMEFFSIGTNDLIQYTLAVDRGNERIAHMYQPLHPAVLRMIAAVVNVGREFGLPVDVCGEMGSEPVCALVLMALGIERLSMAPHAIPKVKDLVRSVRMDLLRDFGIQLLEIPVADDVKKRIYKALPYLIPGRDDLVNELNDSSVLANA